MNPESPELDDNLVRLVLYLDGPLIRNMDVKLADLRTTHSTLMTAALDWYSTQLADQYRILRMDDLPQLSERPEMTNWASGGTTAHFLLEPLDYERLETHMFGEGLLDVGEAGKKILQCYLHGVGTSELDITEIRSRHQTDEYGFYHAPAPPSDPRVEGQ